MPRDDLRLLKVAQLRRRLVVEAEKVRDQSTKIRRLEDDLRIAKRNEEGLRSALDRLAMDDESREAVLEAAEKGLFDGDERVSNYLKELRSDTHFARYLEPLTRDSLCSGLVATPYDIETWELMRAALLRLIAKVEELTED